MESLKELYKVGRGPSSSHTLAPERACLLFNNEFGPFPYYEVDLYGSLSLTGKGHGTDQVIKETLPGEVYIRFNLDWEEEFPNGFYLKAFNENKELQQTWTIFSLGGGSIYIKEYPVEFNKQVYKENTFHEIIKVLEDNKINLLEYVYSYEKDLKKYLSTIFDYEIKCVENGLKNEGYLPGKLKMKRTAKELYTQALKLNGEEKSRMLLISYAYAASEENGDGKTCVTAPTLGACGVMAALVYYYYKDLKYDKERIVDALAIGGIFGNNIKQNASISGAVAGCQAEIGTAVSMASAACAYLEGEDTYQIEYAAEIGMEHNLGLTCDPVMGYVMIPCIERNAMGILRARDAALLSKHMSRIKKHVVSFDMVVNTMKETGMQIPISLKETSTGGLAKEFLDE